MKKKLRSRKAFSFVEMLVCVITLSLVAAICTTATGISIKSFQESRFESDSQMLQSTADLLLGDILRYAHTVTTDGADGSGNVLTFSNDYYAMKDGKVVIHAADSGEAFVNRFIMENGTGDSTLLLGEKVYAETLKVEDFILTYNKDSRTFSGSYKIVGVVRNDLSRTCEFSYRTIAR